MALLPRRLLNIGRILSQQKVNCRLCSSSSSDGGDKKEDKLLGLLSSFKDQKMHQKTVELKAKPTKRNVNPKAKSETSSSSSSSSSSDEELDQEAVQAVQNVAKAKSKRMKGNDDEKFEAKMTIESALLGRLKKINAETKTARQESEVSDVEQKDIASLFKNLKVVKEEKEPQMIKRPPMTKDVEAFLAKRREMRREARNKEIRKEYVPTNLFGEEKPLGIFSSDAKQVVTLKTWQAIEERELRILKTQPPRNLIEDLVSMTDDGQLWHFPINNEQGIEENEMDSFIDHVFLEGHIESWCPASGPLREFMEVICTLLSKNAFMTVSKKVEHLEWFRNYFEGPEQKDILKISGAIE